jgi:phosphatidylglycerophosphatase A
LLGPIGRLGLPVGHPAVLIATGFGAGLLPGMPGTWGSLVALPGAWGIRYLLGAPGLAAAAVLVFGIGCWAAARTARASERGDAAEIVIDEIAGQWLALVVAPLELRWYVVAFALFRLFDIAKPWPANWVDRRMKTGLGIMLDDGIAGLYALVLVWVGRAAFGV